MFPHTTKIELREQVLIQVMLSEQKKDSSDKNIK